MIPFVVTGDTHREYGRLQEIYSVMGKYAEKEKYLCVAGDFGYIFEDNVIEHKMLDEMEAQDFTFVVVPGNHENYEAIYKYPIVDFHGAKAYKIRKNIFYIGRGEIFRIGETSFFAMSGGFSVDRYMRRKHISWWEAEMPTDAEYRYAAENIEKYRKAGGRIDYVISHAAPTSALVYLGRMLQHGMEESPLNNFLEYVREMLGEECKMHFFGHMHLDRELPSLSQRALWFDYVELML